MIIEDEIYGIMPSEKSEACEKAPPTKISDRKCLKIYVNSYTNLKKFDYEFTKNRIQVCKSIYEFV